MAKKDLEKEVEALNLLRTPTPENEAALRKALGHRNNYYVGRAAKIAGESGMRDLVPSLLGACERFYVEEDPQCWAKAAAIRALGELSYDESAPYLRGLSHVQMEPVWGGQKDVAGTLRATCAWALVHCRDLPEAQVFLHLVDRAFDSDKTVRVEVVRAIGRMSGTQAALLLRMRALAGDQETEVFGVCLAELLALEGSPALEFAGRYLMGEDDKAAEAALAIATLRSVDAFAVLKQRWERGVHADFGAVLLHAIALTRCEDAVEYLRGIVRREARGDVAARKALTDAGNRVE